MTADVPAGNPSPADAARAHPSRRLPRRWHNLLLTGHITVAVGTLATDAILLTLGITGRISNDADLIRAVYLTMEHVASAVLLPLAVTAILTGILLGLSTPWGLTRHYWVLTKLVLAIAAATAAAFVLRPTLEEAASTVLARPPAELTTTGIGPIAVRVITAPTIGVLLLTTAVVLAVYKPWGATRFRRR